MIKISKVRTEKMIFCMMLIFSCIAYTGYYLYAYQNRIILLISYSRSINDLMSITDPLTLLIRFGKDICAVVLLLIELKSINKSFKAIIVIGAMAVFSYGTIVALANNLPLNTIISGYRTILYFTALLLYFSKSKFMSLNNFLKIVSILLALNTFIAIFQAYNCLGTRFTLIGKGSYRFMGLFPAAAAYAFFCLGAVLFACIIESISGQFHKNCVLIIIISFIGCYLSGTRSALLNCFIIIYIHMINKSNLKLGYKIVVTIIFAIPMITLFIAFVINMADRGSIIENAVNGGRITRFFNYTINQPFHIFLFGSGIGAGSNSAAEFALNAGIEINAFLDGTFTTIIYQYGMCGALFCVIIIYHIAKVVYYKRGLFLTIIFTFTVVLQCVTTNILEAYAMLIMLFTCYYTLIEKNILFAELAK